MSALAVSPGVLEAIEAEPTLDDLISGIRQALAAGEVVACPVCGGGMRADPLRTGGARGCCTDCGSLLE